MDPDNSVFEHIGGRLLQKIGCVLKNACYDSFFDFVHILKSAQHIFIVGAGRSGLVGRFFAMRLMHLGRTVYCVGDTTTPSIKEGDLLVAISGSGNTSSVVNTVLKAKREGADVVCICLKNKSAPCAIAEHSDIRIKLERRCHRKKRQSYVSDGTTRTLLNITPLGTVYELSALLYFESVIAEIIKEDNVPETELKKRHANLE